jgi:hypothetical protein
VVAIGASATATVVAGAVEPGRLELEDTAVAGPLVSGIAVDGTSITGLVDIGIVVGAWTSGPVVSGRVGIGTAAMADSSSVGTGGGNAICALAGNGAGSGPVATGAVCEDVDHPDTVGSGVVRVVTACAGIAPVSTEAPRAAGGATSWAGASNAGNVASGFSGGGAPAKTSESAGAAGAAACSVTADTAAEFPAAPPPATSGLAAAPVPIFWTEAGFIPSREAGGCSADVRVDSGEGCSVGCL